MKLVYIEEWCETCSDEPAEHALVDDNGTIIGFYCNPCGEQELERIKERRKPFARCHYNYNTNKPCLLADKHDGDHDLPCVEASAHGPHAKGGCAADGTLYRCGGHRFDHT